MLLKRRIQTRQPQYAANISPDYKSGLACLVNPSIGKINLVDSKVYSSANNLVPRVSGMAQANAVNYACTLGAAVSVPSGSDFTVAILLDPIYSGGIRNAGLFRSATGGDTFCIIKTTENLPWVRLNSTDVYNASSGPAVPSGRPVAVVFSIRSGKQVDIAWDGKIQHSQTFSTAVPAFTFTTLGNQSSEDAGDFALFAFWTKYYTPDKLSANPWQIFTAPSLPLFAAATGGGTSTDLILADARHSHEADSLMFSSASYLAVQDATHAHIADSIALTTRWLLTVADAAHAHAADNITLSLAGVASLSVSEGTHAHAADNLGLSLLTWLAIVDAAHAHTADAPTLTATTALQVAEALHAHFADAVGLYLTPEAGDVTAERVLLKSIVSAILSQSSLVSSKFNKSSLIASRVQRNSFLQ